VRNVNISDDINYIFWINNRRSFRMYQSPAKFDHDRRKRTFSRESYYQKRAPQTAKKFIKEIILSNQIIKIWTEERHLIKKIEITKSDIEYNRNLRAITRIDRYPHQMLSFIISDGRSQRYRINNNSNTTFLIIE
jgi:hypothetical protein